MPATYPAPWSPTGRRGARRGPGAKERAADRLLGCQTREVANAPAARDAVQILRLLAAHAEPMPAAAIARDLALPRSTTYHLLNVLRESGFVIHLPEDRRWGLGLAAFELGSAYSRQAPLQRVARPVLARLVDRSGQNAHLAVLHGREVLYLIEERAPGRAELVSDVGVRLPAQLTASGLAMLALLPPAQVRALYPDPAAFVRRYDSGPTGPSDLRGVLTRVRRQGYAVEDGSVTPQFASVAAAATDHVGHPVAGVALTFRATEVEPARWAGLAEHARVAAQEITARLAGRR